MQRRVNLRSLRGAGVVVSAAVLMTLPGCGSNLVPVASTSTPAVTQSTVSVPGSIPPANPDATGNASTPADLNRSSAQIYQRAAMPDTAITKVLILVPGFLGGAGDFDYMARRVVERSQGRTAVWAVDRRSNGLEDQTGLDAAEAAQDADVAKDYYFHGASINGRTFAGFVQGSQVPFESEWGVKTTIEDLDALVTRAIARYPNAAIILGGHSLGGSLVPIYAAWDFGAYAGFERLSGLVLLEGAPNPQGPDAIPSQQAYETTGIGGAGTRTSLKMIRTGSPIVESAIHRTRPVRHRRDPCDAYQHALR